MRMQGNLLAQAVAFLITVDLAVVHAQGHAREKRTSETVIATINGEVVSWVNDFTGGVITPASTVSVTAEEPVDATASPVSDPEPCKSWDSLSDDYILDGFGQRTEHNDLHYIYYKGNVGSPWGSNIIEVSAERACRYQYVIRLEGSRQEPVTVIFWNKFGPDGKLTGWYGNSALTIRIPAGESRYVAVDQDTQGAFGAASGQTLPVDQYGGYSCTWGEFDFGNNGNDGWSGWDVSAIQAQLAGQEVQGMKICNSQGKVCSSITEFATEVDNAYTKYEEGVDGIGGSAIPGPIRLVVSLDYK